MKEYNADTQVHKLHSSTITMNLRKWVLMTPQQWFVYKIDCLRVGAEYVQWLEKSFG